MSKYDFSGWATKNDIQCSDGRTILRDAFKPNDGQTVPLVWNHNHDDPFNVLGHALLENRKEGVYVYGTFNDTDQGRNAKSLVDHSDITALSIYANKLVQQAGNVIHGAIREVSLVLASANPGAFIDSALAHGEGSDEDAIIYTGEELVLEHADINKDEESKKEEPTVPDKPETPVTPETPAPDAEKTMGEVFTALTEEQKTVVAAMIGQALENAGSDNNNEEDNSMKHNVFDTEEGKAQDVLMHTGMDLILKDSIRLRSLKTSFLEHADTYGITNIDWLFPEAKTEGGAPQFIRRTPSAWVDSVMKSVHHTPFSRIKSMFADITEDEARAKGYTKGNLKMEEVFGLLKRTTEPTTVYKKQKIDRDDAVDIVDFDVVAWLKAEMRVMLDAELACSYLFGDKRNNLSPDKISEDKIRPIISDVELFTIKKTVTKAADEELGHAIIKAVIEAQDTYQGSGNLTFYTASSTVTSMLLLEDKQGRRLYNTMADLALAMNVNAVQKVPSSVIPTGYYGVVVDLADYSVGADKGGSINMFDDFDIDYNQQKYLIETRCSAALTVPYSAIALLVSAG